MKRLRLASKAAGARTARGASKNGQELTRAGRGSQRLISAARSFAARIADFEVADKAAADLAGRWRLQIDEQERKVVEWFAPAKQAAFKAHAAICRLENEALSPYRQARRMLNSRLAAWQADQERLLRIEDRRRLAPADVNQSADGELVPLAQTAESTPRVEGVSFRENWRAEVIDKLALVGAVAANPELINLVEPNLAALTHLARAQKSALRIPGVRVWCERIVAASRR